MILSSIVVARVLGKEGFGQFGVIQATVLTFQVFAGFGLGMTATKYIAQYIYDDPNKVGRIIALSLIISTLTAGLLALGLFICAPWLAVNALAAPKLSVLLRYAAFALFFGALNGALTGALVGFEAYKMIARVNAIAGVISFPLLIGGVLWKGLTGAVLGFVITMAVNWVLNYWTLRRIAKHSNINFDYKECFKEISILVRFSMPAALSSILVAPVLWVCNVMLVKSPGGYFEMGLYNAANQWRSAILFIPSSVGIIVLPILSSFKNIDNRSDYFRVLKSNILFNALLALFLAVLVSAFSLQIMGSYGRAFIVGNGVLILLSFSAVLSSTVSVVGHVIASRDQMWWGFALNLVWAISLIMCAHVLIKKGAYGLALANFIAYGIHLITSAIFIIWLHKKHNIQSEKTISIPLQDTKNVF